MNQNPIVILLNAETRVLVVMRGYWAARAQATSRASHVLES
jgi:hypothetical protein